MEDSEKYQTISALSKTDVKRVICPYCRGEGLIEQKKFYGHTDGWIPSYHKCGICNGARILERKVTIEYKPI
jgi:DnaJ-class molecular chaperone